MILATNGRMRGQNEARSPIVFSCSAPAVGSMPCPMVLRDLCRNCSVRLIPPYSVHPPASALRSETRGISTSSAGINQAKSFNIK